MARSEIITDAWEVTKTYAGRIAEWVLFGCMMMNIIEILPGVTLWPALSNIVLGTQVVMLDVGGFSLASMGDHARQQGDEQAARRASLTGGFLIGIMILTLLLVSIGLLWPAATSYTNVAEKGLILVRVIMTVIYGHVIHSLRRAGAQPTQAQVEALAAAFNQQLQQLASELARVQQDFQQRIEQRVNLLDTQQGTTLTTVKQEVQMTIASLTPDRLMASLTGHIETLLQERIKVSLAEMRSTSAPKVSSETRENVSSEASNIRLLTPQKVSRRSVKQESDTAGEGTNIARIYALLNEDRSRKPAEIQRLTGIPKATVYRLVERYHRENPLITASTRSETKHDEEMRGETETGS